MQSPQKCDRLSFMTSSRQASPVSGCTGLQESTCGGQVHLTFLGRESSGRRLLCYTHCTLGFPSVDDRRRGYAIHESPKLAGLCGDDVGPSLECNEGKGHMDVELNVEPSCNFLIKYCHRRRHGEWEGEESKSNRLQ